MELRGPGEMFGERQSGMLSTGLSCSRATRSF